MPKPLLAATDLTASYGQIRALKPASIEVSPGEVVVVLGPNGAGKSTLMRALMGLIPSQGEVLWDGSSIGGLSVRERTLNGMVLVPEGRSVLGPLSAMENLELGAYGRRRLHRKPEIAASFDLVFQLFPRLHERRNQQAGSLSGGEQQMLAIGRGLMAKPRILLLDEPSLGLAPKLVAEIFIALRKLNEDGLTLLIVEQKAPLALEFADRAYVLRSGNMIASRQASELRDSDTLARLYLAYDS